jgi:hypothetical protein
VGRSGRFGGGGEWSSDGGCCLGRKRARVVDEVEGFEEGGRQWQWSRTGLATDRRG